MRVVFYNSKDNDSWLTYDRWIAFFSRGKYSHCEIVSSYNGKCFSMSPNEFIGRFSRFDNLYKKENYESVHLKNISRNEEKLIFKAFEKYDGVKYDWFGAAFSIFNTCKFESKKKYFCSEVIVHVLKKNSKEYEWLPDGCKTSPVDFYRELTSHK